MKIIILSLSLVFSSATIANFEAPSTQNVTLTNALDLTVSGHKAKRGNDIWGWTDSATGKEYAIMGLDNKTSFVDITDPAHPVHIADLKTSTVSSIWRDIKVYKDHAYIVSEAYNHGMQIFDLSLLRSLDGKKVKVYESKGWPTYKKFGSAHNIAINEDSGYAYGVGTSTCDGGLHIINIKNPKAPYFVNCVGRGVYELPKPPVGREDDGIQKHGDAYTHDVQCVIYSGPDSRFLGREICVSSNEDTINVVDVTDKSKPYQISVSTYGGVRYTHQGWLTEDQRYFLLGDELDEQKFGVNTKTFIWNFSDLLNIKHFATFTHKTRAIDHNMYVKGNHVYQANYEAGMRILDLSDVANGNLTEIGFMDPMPSSDESKFNGVWSLFPYFDSGTVVVSGTNGTLYITRPQL